MPGTSFDDPQSSNTAQAVSEAAGIAPAVRICRPAAVPPVPDDVAEGVAPLLASFSVLLGSVPVAMVMPLSLSDTDYPDQDAVPVLAAMTEQAMQAGWDNALAQAAPEARRRAGESGGSDPVALGAFSMPSPDGGTPASLLAWPVPFDGDAGALMAIPSGSAKPLEEISVLVKGFAGAIGAILGRVGSQRRRQRASTALLEVARTAGSTLHFEEVLSLVTERTATLVGADRCGVWLLEKDGRTLLPSAMYGMSDEFVAEWKKKSFPLESEPLSKEAIESRKPVLVNDATTDLRTDKDAVRFFGDKTILVLPMIAKGQLQGSLFINHVGHYHNYSKSEMDTAIAIASQAAIAIQNARLYREVEEWSSQLERLQAILGKLSRSNSVSSIANIIADELRNLISYDNCRVFVVQEDTNDLVPLAAVSSSEDYSIEKLENLRLEMGQGITGYVASTGAPQLIGDVERDPRSYHVPGTSFLDESMIAAPINFEGRVIGVITLSRVGLGQFAEGDLKLLDIFANEAAIEFENARLYQETQNKSRELLASFHRVGDALATGLDPDQTLQIIVNLAAEMVRAKACAILLLDESDGELVFKAAKGLPPELSRSGRTHASHGLSLEVVKDGAPKLYADISGMDRPPWMNRDGSDELRSFLGVPMAIRGKPVGVLAVFGGRTGQFGQADVELLSSFAHQAAIAMRNAQLFTSLQERVRELTGLAEISHSVATLTNLEDTYRELSRSIAQLLQCGSCVLLLVGEDGELLPQQPAFGFSEEELPALGLRVGSGDQPSSAGGRGAIQSVDGLSLVHEGEWTRQSALVAPMRAQDHMVGAVLVTGRLDFGFPELGFNENDVRLLTILAANAAVIVQNAILYQSVNREREELDAVISNTSDAIIIIDSEGCVVRVNAAAETLVGWSAEEVIGQSCQEALYCHFTASKGDSKVAQTLQEVLEKNEPTPYFETVVVTRDGTSRDVAASYSFVRTPGTGGSLGVIIARDISKMRELERMKSEFVSMVSHELRTPLGLIKGYASTLLNPQLSLDTATVQRFLTGIDGAADRLARLIENVLSVSRIESGMLRLSSHPVDLSHLVSSAVTTARATARGVEIQLELPRRPVKVDGDRVQLELVMDNLLGNAIKYSPMGRPIRVEMDRTDSLVVVRVIDQGIGIAPQHLAKVFDKFYRVEGGYSRRTPGSGLGLYICRSILEAHGGRIWAESTLGVGSTFCFSVPLSHHHEQQSEALDPDLKSDKGDADE